MEYPAFIPDVNGFAQLVITVLLAVLLDVFLGEPKRFHPLVGFGYIVSKVESIANASHWPRALQFISGLLSWLLTVLLPTLVIVLLVGYLSHGLFSGVAVGLVDSSDNDIQSIFAIIFTIIIESLVLYCAIGYTSLRQHTMAIITPLRQGDIAAARTAVGMIVSRDTTDLDEPGVCKASAESVLENGSDAIFAPIFWFVLGGVPAVLIYRLSNTLDAMWGYKTERYLYFGRFAARMDDILNYLPSRLVGLSYAVLGNTRQAFRCWHEQAHLLESPSGGVVMSAGAGALNVCLGGDTAYHGKMKSKPIFGCGHPPTHQDVYRSVWLVSKTLWLWCAVLVSSAILLVFAY